MDEDAFDAVMKVLVVERGEVAKDVNHLHAQLVTSQARLRDIESVIEGLRRLTSGGALSASGSLMPSSTNSVDVESLLAELESDSARPAATDSGRKVIKRVRSTEMVAALVNDQTTPLSREEVLSAFEHRYGFPDSWADPRNAVGNALSRAVSKGLIDGLDGDRFAPLGWRDGDGPRVGAGQ